MHGNWEWEGGLRGMGGALRASVCYETSSEFSVDKNMRHSFVGSQGFFVVVEELFPIMAFFFFSFTLFYFTILYWF